MSAHRYDSLVPPGGSVLRKSVGDQSVQHGDGSSLLEVTYQVLGLAAIPMFGALRADEH